MKDIKDYLHLYLGCDCEHDCWTDSEDDMPGTKKGRKIGELDIAIIGDYEWFNPKPILRPLSDMTEEEQAMCNKIHDEDAIENPMLAQLPFYLLKQGFDLFGLIESGLAIDKTTINNT